MNKIGMIEKLGVFVNTLSSSLCLIFFATTYAQESGAVNEEIIVTAQRRETNLQDTPIAISTLSKDDLRARNLSDTSELTQYVPNLSITPGGGNSRSPSAPQTFIRGIGQNDFIINSDPGVSVYVDGVYLSRATASMVDLLDIQRIEVLRGPQGTLFGKNTVGGAINITTAAPANELTYEAEVIAGSYDRIEGRGYVSAPLTDNVSGKLALAVKSRDGYGKRLGSEGVQDRVGGNENVIGRAGLRVELSPDVMLDLSADVTMNRDDQLPDSAEYFDTDPTQGLLALYNSLVGVPAGAPLTSAFELNDNFDSFADGFNFSDQDIYGTSATVTWELEAVTFKSITAFRSLESSIGSDGDGSPLDLLGSIYDTDQTQFTQEFQAFGESVDGKLSWLGGIYYLTEDATEFTFGFAADGLFNGLESLPAAVIPFAPGSMCPGPFPPNVCLGGPGNPFNSQLDVALNYDYDQTIDSASVFGEATYDVTDQWAITAGLRYTDEQKELDINGIARVNSGVVLVPDGTQRDVSFDAFTPRVRIEYKPTGNLLIYAGASRGFKSGGINGRVFSPAALNPFDPEFVWTYEVGFKSDLLDNRLRLNGAAFLNDYEDLQVTIQDTSSGVPNAFITNAAAAEIIGLELEANAVFSDSFQVGGSYAYLDTEITEVDPGVRDFSKGDPLQKVPEHSFSIFAQLNLSLDNGYQVLARADYSYKSEYFNDPILSQSLKQNGFGLLGVRFQLTNHKGWTLALFGTNLTDEDYLVAGLDGTSAGLGIIERIYGRPREIGLSLRIAR